MKTIRIFLLVLIIIGIGLLLTQNIWVPKLVDYILGPAVTYEPIVSPLTTNSSTTPPGVTKKPVQQIQKISQGFFGTVSNHVYGCGPRSPLGLLCDTNGITTLVGEGTHVTVNVADKIDTYGNINSKHVVADSYTDKNGNYKISIGPGNYLVCVENTNCANNGTLITLGTGKSMQVNLTVEIPRS